VTSYKYVPYLRFAVIGLFHTHSPPDENNFYRYNTMLSFIPVSFCTAYIFVTFRVRVRVRVSFRVRVPVKVRV